MITRTEVFDILTIHFKNKNISDILLFMSKYTIDAIYLRYYTLSGNKFLQIMINNIVLTNIRITKDNRKLLKPFIARVEEDL